MLRLIKRLFLLGAGATLIAAAAAWWSLQQFMQKPLLVEGESTVLSVEPGSNIFRVARDLSAREILSWPEPFILYARITGKTAIQLGEYQVLATDTPLTLLEKLLTGEVIRYYITFPEGLTFSEWLVVAGNHPKLAKSATELDRDNLQQRFGLAHLEGWFFPETYQFTGADSVLDVLTQAHSAMRMVLDEEWAQRSENLPYKNAYDALIMASIIERETGDTSEREKIAGVFVRRLQKGMRLQTDPTVIYGLGDRYKGNLTRRHLAEKTPYNTYRINGLPPTPIAMPGRAAIHAALHPEDGNALYFVAKGDGSHYFSASLSEHLRAVKKYQLQRNSGYRSSPRRQ